MSVTASNQGLYEARREHDACGCGAVVNINGAEDYSIIGYRPKICGENPIG